MVHRVIGSSPSRAKNLFPSLLIVPLLLLTCLAAAVDDEDLTVSSDHRTTPDCLYVHSTLGIMGRQY